MNLTCGGRKRIQAGLKLSDAGFDCMVAQLSHFAWSNLVMTWTAILAPD
jgi:hypothetical protein